MKEATLKLVDAVKRAHAEVMQAHSHWNSAHQALQIRQEEFQKAVHALGEYASKDGPSDSGSEDK